LQPGDIARYNQLYAGVLGIVDKVSYLAVRDADLKPLPVATPLINDTILHHWEFYGADVWKIKPSLTLAYGLLYQWHTPPTDNQGRQSILVYKDSQKPIDVTDYLNQKRDAALQGDIFNPDIAYLPINQSGRSGVFEINRKDFSPRISASWSPSFKEGWLGKTFGGNRTVIRGGYSLTYDRANTVATVIIPMLGVGFAQTLSILGPKNGRGEPFRAEVDGNIPVPVNTAATSPVVPDKPFGELLRSSTTRAQRSTQPRHRSHNSAWVTMENADRGCLRGRLGRELYQSYNLIPIRTSSDKKSDELCAGLDNVAAAPDRAIGCASPQAWFENQLGAGATELLPRLHR
jgi:hypothetical protein